MFLTLALHRCGVPSPGWAEVPRVWVIFPLLFGSWVSILATVVASVLNRVPSLPISGCSWGAVYKWHKKKFGFPKKFQHWAGGGETCAGKQARFLCTQSDRCPACVCKCFQRGFLRCALFRLSLHLSLHFFRTLLTAGIIILSQASQPLAVVVTWKLYVAWTVTSITALEDWS